MYHLFKYNWHVRDEWFHWCKQLTAEDLLSDRVGGVGSILYTLFHIIDVEYSWIRAIQGEEDKVIEFKKYYTLENIISLSYACRSDIEGFIEKNSQWLDDEHVTVSWDDEEFTKLEILNHVIVHEIHHHGQLSVWARELNLVPVGANYIGRGLR
ncbi:DinB family protein [Bacillus sp. SCS-151]|uniref:DinB family protein n=1 Tax=Nanhaiella sioensis TaxID=3115293 RepID=UPI00397ACDE2